MVVGILTRRVVARCGARARWRPGGPGIRDVEASCQRGSVRCSPLEVPAVCAGGTGGSPGPATPSDVPTRRAGQWPGPSRRGRGYDRSMDPPRRSMDARASTDRSAGALRDLRISVTDRCNFRCTYCMPKEVFGRDFAVPAAATRSSPSRRSTRLARLFVGLGVEKLRITGGEPLVRRDLPDLIAMLAALRRPDGGELDLTLTTNGSALRALAGPLADAGLRAGHGQPRLARRRGVRRDERRRLPGRRACSTGSTPPLEAGLAPIKVNMVVRRGINESSVVPDGALGARDRRASCGSSSTWTSGTPTAGGSTRSCPAAEIVGAIEREMPLEPADAELPRARSPTAGAIVDGAGEFGVIASVTPAVLRRLHARAAVGRGQALHVPVRGRGHGPPGRSAARRRTTGAGRVRRGDLGAARRPLLGAALAATRPRARTCPRSRCSRSAAERARSSTGLSTAVGELRGQRAGPRPRSSWITALTRPRGPPYRSSCPKGPTGTKEPRSHQGLFGPPPVASGASLPGTDGSSHHGLRPRGPCPTGRDRHPGVDTSVGPTKSAGLGRLPPGRDPGGPHDRCPADPASAWTRPDRSRPPTSPPGSPRSRRPSAPAPPSSRESASSWGPASAAWPTTSRTPVAIPFADLPGWPAATAPGPRRPAPARPPGRAAGRHAPGPVPPLRGQRPGPRRPAGAALPSARRARRGPDQRRRRPRPAFGPGTLMVMRRPHQPDRPNPLLGRTPTSSARASPT